MENWFEGKTEIDSSLELIHTAMADAGQTYVEIVSLMPGISEVELIDQGVDHVQIKTNEGTMLRNNIQVSSDDQHVTVEFDETYNAGRLVSTEAHFRDEFRHNASGIIYHTIISDLNAHGIMGFFFRKFGSSNTGQAFLAAWKTHLENMHLSSLKP